MNKFRFTIKLLVIATFLLAFASIAQAQATRTWVSGVGDDANPCSRTAPCKTFAGAISKTAAGGEINVLDPGGFGAVTITKSITISSECFEAGVLVSGTNGIVISSPGNGSFVTLRGLDIEGLGTGLAGVKVLTSVGQVTTVNIENCTFNKFTQGAINVAASSDVKLNVINCIIRNSSDGILASTSAGQVKGSITNTSVTNNTQGIHGQANARLVVTNCNISGNVNNGVLADGGTTGVIRVTNSNISNNGTNGLSAVTTGVISINGCDVYNNNGTAATASGGGQIFTFGNNRFLANGSDTCSGCTPAGPTF